MASIAGTAGSGTRSLSDAECEAIWRAELAEQLASVPPPWEIDDDFPAPWELVDDPRDARRPASGAAEAQGAAEVESATGWAGPAVDAGERLGSDLAAAQAAVAGMALPPHRTVGMFEGSLMEGVSGLGRVLRGVHAAWVALATEAHERGLHTQAGLGFMDWLRHHVPGLSASDANALADVVRFGLSPEGVEFAREMLAGSLALHRAALVARTMRRLRSSLTPEQRERYTEIATGAAARTDLTDGELRRVCGRLIEDLLDESEPGEREKKAYALRGASSRRLGNGLTRFTVDAPNVQAAMLSGVMTGALAAPQPGPDGEADLRSGANRRFDALLAVVGRGITNPGAAPSTGRSTVILTLPFDPRKGRPTGPGVTPAGDLLSAREAAQLACDGEITPVWLSPSGEPLRLGKDARYATPGQWKALVARDQHCTFPGCTRLPQWCDSHHLVWWSRGGETDIETLVLLCGQHHSHVHQNDIEGEVRGGTVYWHV